MKKIARLVLLSALFIALWQGIISLFDVPTYLLPAPFSVWQRLITQADLLFMHTQITLLEILLGLVFGFLFCATAHPFPQNLGFLNAIISDFTSHSGVCHRATARIMARLWHGIQNHHGDFDYLFSRHGGLL